MNNSAVHTFLQSGRGIHGNAIGCRAAVTLLELTVSLLIISLLVLAALSSQKRIDKAQLASVASTARTINQLATFVQSSTGQWPEDVNNSVIPPEIKPFLSNNIFQHETPMGGRWDWNGPGNSVNNSIGIALRFNPSSNAKFQLLTELDQMIDDGDLTTGNCRGATKNGSYFYIFEIAQF